MLPRAQDPVEIVGVILVGQISEVEWDLAILHRTAGAGQDVGLYSEDPHLTAAVMTDDPIGRRVHEDGRGALLSGRSTTTGRRDCRQSRLEPRTRWTVYSGTLYGQYVTVTSVPQVGQTASRSLCMRRPP